MNITSDSTFLLVAAPFWSKKPLDLEVDEESDIEVNCTAAGTPQPSVAWSINGVPVNGKSPSVPCFTVIIL